MSVALTMDSFSNYEPMQSNWYAVQIDGLDNAGNDKSSLSIACHTCGTPKLSTTQNEFHRINDIVYSPGKSTWDPLSLEFYEFMKAIDTSGVDGSNQNKSAGEILKEWQTLVHNPLTGKQGSKKDVSKNIVLVQFDGEGNTIRSWDIYHAWPTDVDFDGLNSKSGDIMNVKVTLRFDYAVMGTK